MERARTPPAQSGSNQQQPVTPEQVKRIAIARLKAKEAAQARDKALPKIVPATVGTGLKRANGGGNEVTHPNKKVVPAPPAPLKDRIGQYVDYNFDKMINSHGGYLIDENDEKAKRDKERIDKNRKERLDLLNKQGLLHEPNLSVDQSQNLKCTHCGSIHLDLQYRVVFGVAVCKACKAEHPDSYSLLTKTECKEDYLLTDPELKDAELLPYLLKPNPHRPTYSNMQLYLRLLVERYAFSAQKWGSTAALDEEFARRELEKKGKKDKKFEKKLRELRKGTKANVWHKRTEEEHRHEFTVAVGEGGEEVKRCDECGFEVECESF